MVFYGYTHRIGDAITTDQIIAPAARGAGDPAILAAECLADVDPMIAERARENDILLAGENFGAGDEPDLAVLALQAVGFSAVVCRSVDVGFDKTASAYGLPVLVCPQALAIPFGTLTRIDLQRGVIEDRESGVAYQITPCSTELLAAFQRAQLLAQMRRVVEEEGFDG